MSESQTNMLGVIQNIFRWKKQIGTVVMIALLGTTVISLFLPNYYQSTTTFYAASPDLAKPELLFGTSSQTMEYYGNAEDIDRIITIANSSDLANFLIDSFKLYEHYDISKSNAKGLMKVRKKLAKYMSIQKNKYDALELSFEDTDKKFAANVCNAARNKIDEITRNLIRNSQAKMILTFENSIKMQENQLKYWSDSLQFFRKEYGIYDAKSQSELMATLIASAESSLAGSKAKLAMFSKIGGPRDSINQLRAKVSGLEEELKSLTAPESTSSMNITKFNDGVGKVSLYTDLYEEASTQLGEDRNRYEQIKSAFNSFFPGIHIIETASEALEKSRPKRSILIIIAGLMAFVFCVAAVLLIETYKNINWNEIIHPK